MPVPVFNTAYTFFVALADALDPASFVAGPTIASGDFQISLDGATFANLTNLPTVVPTGSTTVQIVLTAAEMNGEKVSVQAIDQAGAEWQSLLATIDIPTGSTESINDLQEGDHVETSTSMVINKKGTATVLVSKAITGSLLSPGITISTEDSA